MPEITYYVRAKVYRGRRGWHVGSRGGSGWPISIWVPNREDAIAIRDAYRDHPVFGEQECERRLMGSVR